jgi:GT2 family glycosyltransferase
MKLLMMQDRLSILIVSYNTRDLLGKCLTSIRTNPPSIEYEVVVVDNASSDGTVEMIEEEHRDVRVIRRTDNPGYGVAVNAGVSHTSGNYLMFLNPDIEVPPGTFDSLLDFFRSHSNAGLIGPKLILGNGEVQNSARPRLSIMRTLFEASRLHLLLPRALRSRIMLSQYFSQSSNSKVAWICGACHLIPRKVWDEVGPLTEETFCGFDDYDYCYRVWKKGYQVWLRGEAFMTHHCSVAVRKRWSAWEVEQVAIHNTYIVLQSHWPKWRIKLYAFSECVSYASEWLRNSIVVRPEMRDMGEPWRSRLGKRIRLLLAIAVGSQQPIKRCQRFGP